MKVYVLVVESTIEYNSDIEIKVFAKNKDAEEVFKAFKEEVEKAITYAPKDWVTEQYDMSFSTYEDGDYLNNHISVCVLEKDVIL